MSIQPEKTEVSTSKKVAAVKYANQGIMVHRVWWVQDDGSCACGDPKCTENNIGKHPIAKWKTERTSDPMIAAKLWEEYPEANIGVSGFTVIDPDRHDGGADGVTAWYTLLNRHESVDTWIVKTPGDGFHYYYLPDSDIGNSEGNLPDGINVRGSTAGYVVAPPSNHVKGTYKWLKDYGPDTIDDPAALPIGIKQLIQNKKPLLSNDGKGPGEINEGHRNQTLTSIAGHLFNVPGMSGTNLSKTLHAMNGELCTPPLSVNEVNGIVKSAQDHFKKNDPNNMIPADFSLWNNQMHDPLDVDRSNLMAETVIRDLLYERGNTVIAGEGGVGKTTILMDMVIQACQGGDIWLSKSGTPINATRHILPFSTLYIDFDMGLPLVAMASLLAEQYEVTADAPGKVRVLSDPVPIPDIWDDQQVDQVASFAVEHGFDLIVFDSMAFMGGNKSMKDDEFGRRLIEIARIFRGYNLMSILVHHTNRQGDYFGSAYIQHSATNLVLIKRSKKDILVKVIKNRYGPAGRAWKLRRVPRVTENGEEYATFEGVGKTDDIGEVHILQEALERSGDQGMNVTGIIRAFKAAGYGEKKARHAIENAEVEKLIALHSDAHDRNKLFVWNSTPQRL